MSASPVAAPATSDVLAAGTEVTYYGYSLCESAGTPAAAVVRIRDGGVVTGKILDTINFTSNQDREFCWPCGVNARGGLYFELVSGAVEGVILIG